MKMIPLTFDPMFKSIFTYDLEILKEFLILETNLDLDPSMTTIRLLNTELPKENKKEYKKIIDIYVFLNENVHIDVELNDSSYNEALSLRNSLYESKMFSMLLEKGEKIESIENKKLIQLNLNTKNKSIKYGEDILMMYGIKTREIYLKNRQTILKYLAYYKKMYYSFDIKLSKSELWLVVILSESFTELYDLLGNVLTDEKREKFIRKVIDLSKDTFILHEWEKEKMDKLREMARLEDAKSEGFERGMNRGMTQGIKQGIQQRNIEITKNMLENDISPEKISNCTGLSLKEIQMIQKENEKEE